MAACCLLYNLLGDGQPVQVHELRQVTQLLHILDLLPKFHTETNSIYSTVIFFVFFALPDDWFEEVVHNTDEMCWMNYKTCFQVLLIAPINNLQEISHCYVFIK